MSFAKHVFIGSVRAVRQAGTVGLFIVGLLVGSAIIAQSPEILPTISGETSRFTATAAERVNPTMRELPSQPWSRVMGKAGFEKVTDVALAGDQMLIFAGIRMGQTASDSSGAMLVRLGPHGLVHSQAHIQDVRLGHVTRAVLGDRGGARLVHWVGNQPGFASVDPDGSVIWSRAFSTRSDSVWAEIETAGRGETLVALTEGDTVQRTRILRLDDEGKVLWRHALEGGDRLAHITLADSGDGGALLATERVTATERHEIAMVRIDRRGREIWRQTLFSDYGAALAHTALNTSGGVVLVGGEPSILFSFDATGQLSWVREVPALDPAGRHLVSENPNGGWHVLAEPQSATQSRRHWLARFSEDGRLDWAQTRTNRSGSSLESAMVVDNGVIIAGGSMQSVGTGDTDMLLMAIGPGGQFPLGLEGSPEPATVPAPKPVILASVDLDQPLLPASAIVDSTLALQVEQRPVAAQVDMQMTALSNAVEPIPTEPSDALFVPALPEEPELTAEVVPAALPIEAPEPRPIPETIATMPEPVSLTVLPAPPKLKPQRTSAAVQPPKAAEPKRSTPNVQPPISVQTQATPQPASASYTFACTFTCLADSNDIVPYPVSRIIDDAAETNASLFALDVMAMDHSVCLSTGGRVFDLPRLPPACERLD